MLKEIQNPKSKIQNRDIWVFFFAFCFFVFVFVMLSSFVLPVFRLLILLILTLNTYSHVLHVHVTAVWGDTCCSIPGTLVRCTYLHFEQAGPIPISWRVWCCLGLADL